MTRVVGGIHAKAHSWPWAAAIMPKSQNEVYCGGTLVSKQWMITAGHCFAELSPDQWPQYKIKFGADDRGTNSNPNEKTQQVVGIKQAIVNPNFGDGQPTHNDITLVQFDKEVEFTDFVKPICLPTNTSGSDNLHTPGEILETIGWGQASSGGEPRLLQQVALPFIASDQCNKDYPGQLDDTMVCAGNQTFGGPGSCFGDSGGALMAHHDGVYKLIGIVSWGPTNCGARGKPTVYGYVPALVDWAKATMQQNSY